MKKLSILLCAGLIAMLAMPGITQPQFKVAWSHYTGWEPWAYANQSGILKKWADKYGIRITLSPPMEYVESMNVYTAGQYDACVMTNMDVLTIPCAGGIDSTVVVLGDYSNGNDGIVLKNGTAIGDIKGRKVKIVQFSVSHYLLARALEKNGMKERDVKLVNTSDSDMSSLFITDSDPKAACVTWNPLLMKVRSETKDSTMVFDSSQVPGEILDTLVVKTSADEKLKKALTGAWFEVMTLMSKPKSPEGKKSIQFMAKNSGGTEQEFLSQLKTTALFYTPKEAVDFTENEQLKKTMEYVRTFCFDHGLYGQGSKSKDDIGILFPDGTVLGEKKNIKLRFDSSFMKLAADGKL